MKKTLGIYYQITPGILRSKVTLTGEGAPTNPDARLTYQCRECSPFMIAIATIVVTPRRRFEMFRRWGERGGALTARLQLVDDGLAVSLTLRHFHHLADEELREFLVALAVTSPLVGVLGDQGLDSISQRT